MLSPFRVAKVLIVIFAVAGLARAQEIAPANSGVSMRKVSIDNGSVRSVKYYVSGGSAQLQALVRRVEWAENELSVVEQLQGLKLDIVVNERRGVAVRTAQLTNPFFPRGFISPVPRGYGGDRTSPLQNGLKEQLAYEATPEAALQLIGYLELFQSQLDEQLKALQPKEQKAAQEAVAALRPRVAALLRRDAAPPLAQPIVPVAPVAVLPKAPGAVLPKAPVAAPPVHLPLQPLQQQLTMPLDPLKLQQTLQQQFLLVQQQLTQKQ